MSPSSSHRRWVIWQSRLDESAVVEFPRGEKPQPNDLDWERIEVVEENTMSVEYEELRRAHPETARAEALTFQAADWLAQQAKDGHGSVWEVQPDGPRRSEFKFEHNGRIYAVTVDELGCA